MKRCNEKEKPTHSTRLSSPKGWDASTGFLPVISSRRTTPNEYTSDLAVSFPVDAYSGAKYLKKQHSIIVNCRIIYINSIIVTCQIVYINSRITMQRDSSWVYIFCANFKQMISILIYFVYTIYITVKTAFIYRYWYEKLERDQFNYKLSKQYFHLPKCPHYACSYMCGGIHTQSCKSKIRNLIH